jgi:integrase
MSNERKGFIVERNGRLYVRIQWTDNLGKRRELMRRAKDRKHARELKKQLVKQLDSADAEHRLAAEKATFKDIAERYKAQNLIEAQYVGDRKVAGRRSLQAPLHWFQLLVEYFGSARLRSITHSAVDGYRLKRLSDGLEISSVNRELELLRAILNYAKREGLIDKTPFELGAPLIRKADETRRTRVMTPDEETRLLAQCVDRRAHLRAIIVCAVDTGMRRGELFTLSWSDVNLPERTISIRAFHTKTAQARRVPISERLFTELTRLYNEAEEKDVGFVFGVTDNVKKSWASACKDAEIEGLRFHDLRATFISRMIQSGMPAEEVSKISGHTQIQTLYAHYLRVTNETIERAADLLNQMHDASREAPGDTQREHIN